VSNIPLGPAELGFIAVYLLSLIGIGYCGMRARTENSLKDFYLGGSGVGFLVLVLTLYATQYSGNTLFAFTGKTYRIGYAWLMSVHFMMAIIVVYLVFAPGLHRLAKRESFITPADFLEHRFSHRPYTVLASITMVVAIGNYLLAQLTAMGLLLQGMTTFEPQTAFVAGVILLAVIMLVYETLGGFRAVAWTDVIQGGILIVGFAILLFVVLDHFGGLAKSFETLKEAKPEKVAAPDALTIRRAKGRLHRLSIAICGDIAHSRVARSNIMLLGKMENRIRLIAPPTLMPAQIGEFGVEVFDDMEKGLKDVDVVMMLRLQKERMDGGFIPSEREYYHRYGLDAEKLAHAKPDAIVMHPGPMNRGVEIDGTLADDINRSVIQDQVEMGVAVRMAAMDLLARNLVDSRKATA